ncbi:DUF6538 domain-containing protein (plasmid) [Paraburkholderia strydomiana]
MCTHLDEREGRYYFRRRVPKVLQPILGKTELSKTLSTSNRAEAVRLCRAESLRSDELFAKLRADLKSAEAPSSPVSDPISAKVRAIVSAAQADADATRRAREDAEREREEDNDWYQAVVSYARDEGLDEDEALAFDREVERRAQLERAVQRRLKDEGTALPQQAATSTEKPQPASKSALYLPALIDKWAKERTPNARTFAKAALVARRFREMVGPIPVKSIERRHAIAFKDALLASGQSASNTNKTLELLSVLLNFARANEMTKMNAAQGVRVLVKSTTKPKARISFNLPALQSIFSSPVYSEHVRPDGGAGEAAYWLPLLALLTGARLEEMCQLAPDDVFEETYLDATGTQHAVPCVRFVHNEERDQGVKNAGSVRRIPLHPILIALGFVEYAHSHKGKPRIFPDLKPNSYGEESGNWSKWFGKYLRGPCAVTDNRMVFHSFRHSFKDACRECSISKDLADAIQGHDDGDASSGYGSEYHPLRPLVEAMSRFAIYGLTLPAPWSAS